MTQLYDRKVELQIEDRVYRDHRVTFEIEKTLKPDPNSAEIKIYNLSPDERHKFSNVKAPNVQLRAGYGSTLSTLWLGQLIHVMHVRESPDWVTILTTGDGVEAYRKARVRLSFGPGTTIDLVLEQLASALGVKRGNLDLAKIKAQLRSTGAAAFAAGCTLNGSAAYELTALCQSAGLQWSIQDGALQFVDLNNAVENFAIVLTEADEQKGIPSTGLLPGTSVDNSGIVHGRTLLIPDMFPGRQVIITAPYVTGAFRLEKCNYAGDTHADDWFVDFEAKGTKPV